VAFVGRCAELCHDRGIEFQGEGLPEGVRRLLRLSHAVPGKLDTRGAAAKPSFLQDLGERAVKDWEGAVGLLRFLGENVLALGNCARPRFWSWSNAVRKRWASWR